MRIRTSVSLMAMGVAIATAAPAVAQTNTGTLQPVRDDFATANDIRAAVVAGQQPETSDGDVIVTGTRIVRPNNRSAAPITTTTAAEIQAQGAVNIEEVLNRLPQIQANTEQNFGDSSGRQRIKLRSLGFERTLTLVDGLRLGLIENQDVSIIPTSMVERVDVLSGGASSVYGSDAVSGVVNFILKKNFEGVRLDANYSFFNHQNRENLVTEAARRANFNPSTGMVNDGGRADITLSAGTNLFDNRVNLSSFINYRMASFLPLASRSHAACQVTQPTRDGPLACARATFVGTGVIIPQSGVNAGRFLTNDPSGVRRFVGLNSIPGTSANPVDEESFQRDFQRVNAGGFLTAEINDEIEFYSSALFYRDESTNPLFNRNLDFVQYAGRPAYQVNCNNPFLSASQAADICGASAGTAATAPIGVRYRFDGLPPILAKFENTGYRAVSGIRGRGLGGAWTYDLAGVFSRNQFSNAGLNLPDYDRTARSLRVVNVNGRPTCQSVVDGTDPTCVPFNAFTPYLADPALAAYLFPPATGARDGQISRMAQVVGIVTGDLGSYGIRSPLADEGLSIALGVEYRDELIRVTANEAFRNINGGTDQRFTQNILEANAELVVPLISDRPFAEVLDLTGGYRLSKYNRLEGNFGTWKIEGIWSPITDITFRGSYNKAQRAPSTQGANNAANVFFNQGFVADPCAPRINPANPNGPRLAPLGTLEQCRNTGLPDNLYGSATLICPDERCTTRNGGFGLEPETAFTKTFGVVLRPSFLPGLTFSADRFLIDIEDELAFFQETDFINDCLRTGNDFFCRGIVRNPGTFTLSSPGGDDPTTGFFARGLLNGFRSKSHGWDFQGQYNLGLASAGRLDFGFNGSLTTLVGNQSAPTVTARNCVGYFGPPGCGESLPEWKHQFRTTWTSPDRTVNISLNWRHQGPLRLAFNAPADTGIPVGASDRRTTFARIVPYNWFDLALSFDVAEQMTFRIAANNIFDRDPPLLPDSRNILGLLRNNTIMGYDILGRNIVAGISLRM